MLLLLFLFGLALCDEAPSDDHRVMLQRGKCPLLWYGFKGRCYKYVATHLSWADAELYCVSEGANLVSIHNLDEQNFVKSLIENFDHAERPTWIGLSDVHKEGRWMWSDGSAADFFFWSKGEPNNYLGKEDCVHNNFGLDLKWNDEPCSRIYASVCASSIICPLLINL